MSFPCLGSKHALSGASSRAQQSVVARVWFARGGSGRRCSPVLASNTEPASSKPSKASNNKMSPEDSIDWTRAGVPAYLQSNVDFNICGEESQALTLGRAGEMMWKQIRTEAQADANSEPLLSSFLYASILAHDTFEQALAFVLANRLANSTMLSTQLFEIFHNFLSKEPDVRCAALSDLAACRERDPACSSYSHALLYFKGYHAIQTQRIAHALWNRKQKVMALALQSRISEVFAVDVHPAARIGKGVLLDHGTGVVIGETAVIGNNVSILQNVTLGGTGKEIGDRHPKVGDNVLIGACATVLGNIPIGEGAQIAAGSLVLKPVPPHTMVAGSPAKEVGPVVGNPALSMMHWSQRLLSAESMDGAGGVGMNGVPLAAAMAPVNGLANGIAKPAAKVALGKAAAAAAAASASAAPASAAASVQAAKKAAAKLGGAAKAAAAGSPAAPAGKAGTPSGDVSQKQGRVARSEVIRKKPAPEYEI